jgi:hypothetical protein
LVFRNPLIYAVAGYGVFSWVKGGVIRKSLVFKRNKFDAKIRDNSVLFTKVKGYILIYSLDSNIK